MIAKLGPPILLSATGGQNVRNLAFGHSAHCRHRHVLNWRQLPLIVAMLVSLGTTAAARDFDHSKVCEAIRNGWEMRIVYRSGEDEAYLPHDIWVTQDAMTSFLLAGKFRVSA